MQTLPLTFRPTALGALLAVAALAACVDAAPLQPESSSARAPRRSLAVASLPTCDATLRAAAALPDLRTAVPQQVQLVNKQQTEQIRFSNAVANTGAGALELRPVFPVGDPTQPGTTQDAVQVLYDASGAPLCRETVSSFEFHPDHNHWHIDAVARFEIRAGSPAGALVGPGAVKTTFCLIDWLKLDGSSRTPDRTYFECNADSQGISAGWIDQYHQATPGQQLDVTGVPPGRYYLVSTANPDATFIEQDLANNTAWVAFDLARDSNGNPKLRVVGTSPCSGGLCGTNANR